MKITRVIVKIALVCLSGVLSLTACHSVSSTTVKDPEKAVIVRTQLAAEYIRMGDFDSAKRALDFALKVNEYDATANMMMGVLLQQAGGQTNLAQADQYFKRAIAIAPDDAQIRNNYGTYLYQMQRYNEAIVQLTRASTTLGYSQRFQALENLGRIYLKLDDLKSAEKSFKQALHINQNATISMLELAEIFYLQQNNSNAAQFYQQYVESVGQNQQGARALWIGLRIARANADLLAMRSLTNQLHDLFPNSPEYQRYEQLQHHTAVVWK